MPTTSASVPLCFGYHPYLKIPGVPREEWLLTTRRCAICGGQLGHPDRGPLGVGGIDGAAEDRRVRTTASTR